MRFRSFGIVLVCCLVSLLNVPFVHAFYDPRSVPNNKAGVHILSPDEIDDAARLVNSNGGDWGYVTVPIQPTDRSKDTWQAFMAKAKALHVIPIIRITTIPSGGTWEKAHDTDLVDFANFLNELNWPIQNRYIILFNEVNRDSEWGGAVNPEKYASIVKNAYSIFKERSADFFLLGPSLDSSLPNSPTSMSAQTYLNRMAVFDPMVWTYFDGWSSHSYPNPGFISPPSKTGLQSIISYKSEISLLRLAAKPVFITETGWDQTKIKDSILAGYWSAAWSIWQKDPNVVAVTPFVLKGGSQFASLSLYKENGDYSASGQSIYNLPKHAGSPTTVVLPASVYAPIASTSSNWILPFFKSTKALVKLENIFRIILGLPVKASANLKDIALTVELAQNKTQWEKGLSDRTDLGDLDGMVFLFPQYHIPIFWMKDMHFPIDIIWLAGGTVVDITRNAPVETSDKLPTYSPKVPVNMVFEVRAGWTAQNNISVGDTLVIEN